MASQITQLFAPLQLTGAAATFYTAPATPTTTVLARGRIRLTNTDSGSHSVTLYAVQSGGSASAANCFLNGESIAANAHLDVDVPLLAAGGFLQGFADAASKVTVTALDGILFS